MSHLAYRYKHKHGSSKQERGRVADCSSSNVTVNVSSDMAPNSSRSQQPAVHFAVGCSEKAVELM